MMQQKYKDEHLLLLAWQFSLVFMQTGSNFQNKKHLNFYTRKN